MNIEEIKERVGYACKHISDTKPEVWYTTEWNICSHLRSFLDEAFSDYDVDVELVKRDGRRPDIVIHDRGNNLNNLIVFQAKKNPNAKDIQEDLDKIKETFFAAPYFYKFGIFISIGKLPGVLPEFDVEKIGIIEVYGWALDQREDNNIQV